MGKPRHETPTNQTGGRVETGWVEVTAIPGTYGTVAVRTSGTKRNVIVKAELGMMTVEVVVDPAAAFVLALALKVAAESGLAHGGHAQKKGKSE